MLLLILANVMFSGQFRKIHTFPGSEKSKDLGKMSQNNVFFLDTYFTCLETGSLTGENGQSTDKTWASIRGTLVAYMRYQNHGSLLEPVA